jgi:hypothetical protein
MSRLKVRNFKEFIEEKKDALNLSDVFQRFYMLVRNPYPDSDTILGSMIGAVRNTLFDQISVNSSNYKFLSISPGIPILNFTEDNDLVQAMINENVIDINSLYNKPTHSTVVSDKVSFHKKFRDCKFIPKTVFSVEDAMNLNFPVIAKPAQGKSAKGIKKFKTSEEMKSSNEKFDIFSEMIDIKKEFRCFCFKGEIIELNERVKIKGSPDFLENTDTTTDFLYKWIDPAKYSCSQEMYEILQQCRDVVNLDFFSIDFAETSDKKLFVIEMNSRTGMGVDKMVELYKLVHKDYYKKEANATSIEKMDVLVKDWEKAYDKKDASQVNECTILAGNLNNVTFLFKNRDRSFTPDTVVVHEKLDGVEVAYYTDQTSWVEGMNEYGVGFVFSQLTGKQHKGYGPAYTVSDEPKDDSKFKRFEKDIKKILTAKNAEEAIKFLINSKKSGNFLIGDKKDLYEVEVFKGENKHRKLNFKDSPYYVKTNHGELFPEAGHQPTGDSIKRAGSSIRRHQAYTQLQGTQNISEIPDRMKFQAFDTLSPLNTFRTDIEEYTISQCMMDLTNLKFYFFHDITTADTLKLDIKIKNPKITIDARKTR